MTEREAVEQRSAALAKANRHRAERSQIRRRLKAAAVRLDAVIDSPALQTLDAVKLLAWLPYVSDQRARQIMTRHQITLTATVGRLTDRQRAVLLNDPQITKYQPKDER